jgi:hypothetical protein
MNYGERIGRLSTTEKQQALAGGDGREGEGEGEKKEKRGR